MNETLDGGVNLVLSTLQEWHSMSMSIRDAGPEAIKVLFEIAVPDPIALLDLAITNVSNWVMTRKT